MTTKSVTPPWTNGDDALLRLYVECQITRNTGRTSIAKGDIKRLRRTWRGNLALRKSEKLPDDQNGSASLGIDWDRIAECFASRTNTDCAKRWEEVKCEFNDSNAPDEPSSIASYELLPDPPHSPDRSTSRRPGSLPKTLPPTMSVQPSESNKNHEEKIDHQLVTKYIGSGNGRVVLPYGSSKVFSCEDANDPYRSKDNTAGNGTSDGTLLAPVLSTFKDQHGESKESDEYASLKRRRLPFSARFNLTYKADDPALAYYGRHKRPQAGSVQPLESMDKGTNKVLKYRSDNMAGCVSYDDTMLAPQLLSSSPFDLPKMSIRADPPSQLYKDSAISTFNTKSVPEMDTWLLPARLDVGLGKFDPDSRYPSTATLPDLSLGSHTPSLVNRASGRTTVSIENVQEETLSQASDISSQAKTKVSMENNTWEYWPSLPGSGDIVAKVSTDTDNLDRWPTASGSGETVPNDDYQAEPGLLCFEQLPSEDSGSQIDNLGPFYSSSIMSDYLDHARALSDDQDICADDSSQTTAPSSFGADSEASFMFDSSFSGQTTGAMHELTIIAVANHLLVAFAILSDTQPSDPIDSGVETLSRGHGDGESTTVSNNPATIYIAHSRTGKRKHRGTPDDDEDDFPGFSGRRAGGRPPSDLNVQLLACPYAKFDPQRYSERNYFEKNYRGCSSCYLRDIPRLKQHLYRVHRRPDHHCTACFRSFENDSELTEHTRQRPSCDVRPCLFKEKMSVDQLRAVKRKENHRDRVEAWFGIFDILFPGAPRPSDPYICTSAGGELAAFLDFLEKEAPSAIATAVGAPLYGPDVQEQVLQHTAEVIERCVSTFLQQVRTQVLYSPKSSTTNPNNTRSARVSQSSTECLAPTSPTFEM